MREFDAELNRVSEIIARIGAVQDEHMEEVESQLVSVSRGVES